MRPERVLRGGLSIDAAEELEQRVERELHPENAEQRVHALHLVSPVFARDAVHKEWQRREHRTHRREQRPAARRARRREAAG